MTNKLALVVAVVLGVLSILGVRFYVEKIKQAYAEKNNPVQLPVATRDLKFGDVIQKGDIQVAEIPHVVVDVLGGTHYLSTETDKFEGAKVVVPMIKQGQVFQTYHFRAQKSQNPKIVLPTGMRAVTVATTPVSGMAGMLRPGDRVDVVVTQNFRDLGTNAGGRKELKITETLLQNVEVGAVDNVTDTDSQMGDYTTVTLKLKPEEVNLLVFVVDTGSPYHLVKKDDADSPSSSTNATFPDTQFERMRTEIVNFFNEQAKRRVNGGR